jgi:hypothetical protein
LHRDCLLQQVIEGKIKWGVEVTGRQERWRRKLLDDLKEREDTHIWRRTLQISLYGELALEEALDLSWDRLLNEWSTIVKFVIMQFPAFSPFHIFRSKYPPLHPVLRHSQPKTALSPAIIISN